MVVVGQNNRVWIPRPSRLLSEKVVTQLGRPLRVDDPNLEFG